METIQNLPSNDYFYLEPTRYSMVLGPRVSAACDSWDTLSGPCKSKAKRFASACTFPITLTEQGLLADKRRGCFNETLDVGAPHSLTVSLLLLLLPTLLSVKSLGHDAGPFLLCLQYQTCCACRLNMAGAGRSHWTRIAQVSRNGRLLF